VRVQQKQGETIWGCKCNPSLSLGILDLHYGQFQNHRLSIRDKTSLTACQLGEQRQFHPLHDRLNSSQMMTASRNLVRRENQLEVLRVAATGEFRKDKLIVRQQQRTPRRNLNA
jgi:hypothetical protein